MAIENRKAFFNYEILERIEAGMVLRGPEVKSLREGRASFRDSFARVDDSEMFLHSFYIAPYPASFEKVEPLRRRKLLLTKREIHRLKRRTEEKGLTLVPLSVYFNKRGLAKMELGLAKGKTLFDKRRVIKEREVEREIRREWKSKGAK